MNEAYARSIDILNPKDTKPINIIGCGSIGSYAAIALGKAGFTRFNLFDGDAVDVPNIGCQMFGWEHIGVNKAEALKELLVKFTPVQAEDIKTFPEFVTETTKLPRLITVFGVDSMAVRKMLWERLKNSIPLLVDGRIGGQVIRVFTIRNDYAAHKFYETTLYSDEQAVSLPCTQSNVADVGYFVGAMILRALRRYISDNHVIMETGLDAGNFITYCTGEE